MDTKISEIADGIYRLSTYVPDIAPPAGFTFNQFLVLGDEPLMFHTGLRKMFPANRDALSRIMPTERMRWIAFGHFEADECGAMNEWLAVTPQATPAHGEIGCMVSLNDFADRPPRVLTDGEVVNDTFDVFWIYSDFGVLHGYRDIFHFRDGFDHKHTLSIRHRAHSVGHVGNEIQDHLLKLAFVR